MHRVAGGRLPGWDGTFYSLWSLLPPFLGANTYFLLFLVSSSLFLSTGWKIWSYDERVCVLSILSAVLSFSVTLVIFRWLSIHAKKIEWTVPCAWILLHTASEYLPLATITLDPLFDAPLFLMQSASLGGIQLYQALLLGLLTVVFRVTQTRNFRSFKLPFVTFGLLLILLAGYGFFRLQFQPPASQGPKMAMIQHNLSPDVLWRIHHSDEILKTYVDWADQAKKNNAELILFPQYDIGKDTFRSPEKISNLAQEIGKYLIFSSYIAVRPDASNDDFKNMAFFYAPDGKRIDFYESVEPFPFRRNPPISAHGYRPLKSPWGLIGMHLCYESSLARVVRKSVRQGALVHMDLANPGFFNDTVIPYYHLLQDQLRAIETGQYVYRVTTNGNSGIIDSRGRIEQLTRLDDAKMLVSYLHLTRSTTLYQKMPFLFPVLATLVIIFQFSRRKSV